MSVSSKTLQAIYHYLTTPAKLEKLKWTTKQQHSTTFTPLLTTEAQMREQLTRDLHQM